MPDDRHRPRLPAARPTFTRVAIPLVLALCGWTCAVAGTKHAGESRFSGYQGRVMCGYQGWYRAPGDGSGGGWAHYSRDERFATPTIDYWPDCSEYSRTYATPYTLADGSAARVFSSHDASTVDVHFRWMREYGIDGVFVQRFFSVTRDANSRRQGRVVLQHALEASQRHGRAIAVMYDLSGLRADGEDCSSVIQDWKELVDELKITAQGNDQTYLYHRGGPLVAIWGVGFTDRPYDIRDIGLERLIDFLKHDPDYGDCSVMLGVPTYFRELANDTVSDPHLHRIMDEADVIMPWTVGRFSSLEADDPDRYAKRVADDIAWCEERRLDYVPCVFPGFSWHNLKRFDGEADSMVSDAIPRQKGRFYWDMICRAIAAKSTMLYVAMFDEMDEGTAIFKCTDRLPVNTGEFRFLSYEGLPSDHYLWLTGQAGRLLRGQIAHDARMHLRSRPASPAARTR